MTMGIVVRLLRRQSRYQAMRDDDVDLETYQLRGEAGKTLGFASGPPVLDGDVLALDVPAIAQSLAECVCRGRVLCRSHWAEEPDPSRPGHCLGARGRNGPSSRRTPDRQDEWQCCRS